MAAKPPFLPSSDAQGQEPAGRFPPGRVLAAPSWVMPGTLAENCAFLAGKVAEAGLLLLETDACLAYDETDLPPALADLPLRYHAHLPTDLPWETPEAAAAACARLLDKTAFLSAPGAGMRAVLHPPEAAGASVAARLVGRLAAAFAALGRDPGTLLLENVAGNNLAGLRGVIREYGLGVCLDTGHALAYGQEALLRDAFLLERTAMLHVNAPGVGDKAARHLPLTALDRAGLRVCADFCRAVPVRAVIMLEMFRWRDILDSLPLVRSWLLPLG